MRWAKFYLSKLQFRFYLPRTHNNNFERVRILLRTLLNAFRVFDTYTCLYYAHVGLARNFLQFMRKSRETSRGEVRS